MFDKLRAEEEKPRVFAIERRAVIEREKRITVVWEPVGLFRTRDLEEAVTRAAYACEKMSCLRVTELPEPLDTSELLKLYQAEFKFP